MRCTSATENERATMTDILKTSAHRLADQDRGEEKTYNLKGTHSAITNELKKEKLAMEQKRREMRQCWASVGERDG